MSPRWSSARQPRTHLTRGNTLPPRAEDQWPWVRRRQRRHDLGPPRNIRLGALRRQGLADVNTLGTDDGVVHVSITPYSLVPAQNGWVLAYVGQQKSNLKRNTVGGPVLLPTYLLLNNEARQRRGVVRNMDTAKPRLLPGGLRVAQHEFWLVLLSAADRPGRGRRADLDQTRDIKASCGCDRQVQTLTLSSGSVCVVTETRHRRAASDGPAGPAGKVEQLQLPRRRRVCLPPQR